MKESINLQFQQGFETEILFFRKSPGFNPAKQNFSSNQNESNHADGSHKPTGFELKEGYLGINEILVLVLVSKSISTQTERLKFSRNRKRIRVFSGIKNLNPRIETKSEIAFSGIVIRKGKQVIEFQIGDEVLGFVKISKTSSGSHLKIGDLEQVFHKPSDLTFQDSVSILAKASLLVDLFKKAGKLTYPNSKTLILFGEKLQTLLLLKICGQYHKQVWTNFPLEELDPEDLLRESKTIFLGSIENDLYAEKFNFIFDLNGILPNQKVKELLETPGVYSCP
ncbi:hypothetical protein D0X99_16510 [Algoriphagus lacus]|uniref:Uncharacterized protein n=1 Tax=Algoriphagus lacus TaxID=2056311 RepID=A0A418PNS3_9BACT|nr:hypothetical protein [Algoriphagus lacus]RIW13376.1 hypothetical protein D0X99_16510 [Algoriphagus lacus]